MLKPRKGEVHSRVTCSREATKGPTSLTSSAGRSLVIFEWVDGEADVPADLIQPRGCPGGSSQGGEVLFYDICHLLLTGIESTDLVD